MRRMPHSARRLERGSSFATPFIFHLRAWECLSLPSSSLPPPLPAANEPSLSSFALLGAMGERRRRLRLLRPFVRASAAAAVRSFLPLFLSARRSHSNSRSFSSRPRCCRTRASSRHNPLSATVKVSGVRAWVNELIFVEETHENE